MFSPKGEIGREGGIETNKGVFGGCWGRAGQSEEVFDGNTLLKLLAAAGVKTPLPRAH